MPSLKHLVTSHWVSDHPSTRDTRGVSDQLWKLAHPGSLGGKVTLTFSHRTGQLRSGSRPDPRVYADLIHSYSNAGEFSTCFTELQRDFISSRPTKLKSLIRLVKHWYQQVRHGAVSHPNSHTHTQGDTGSQEPCPEYFLWRKRGLFGHKHSM